MFNLFRDGFARDLLILLVISILVGTVLSTGVARAVDTYFGDTINGLIGDYGEYDLILHIREDAKEAALTELDKLESNQIPGMKTKESLTIAGKLNLFVSIPDKLKTKETMENLRGLFGDIPGYTGYTLIIEPAIVIRSTHASLRERLITEIEQVEGVQFVFKDAGSLYALLDSVDHNKPVSEAINGILEKYQILEVRFPMGQGVDDVTSTGAVVMAALDGKYQPQLLEDITLTRDNDNYQAFVTTLAEMKHFLESYATKVTIPIEGTEPLMVGDKVAVAGSAEGSLTPGSPVGESGVLIEVTSIVDGEAKGLIVKGDVSDVGISAVQTGYKVSSDNQVGAAIGQVHLKNDKYQLIQAVDESVRLLSDLDTLSGTADEAVANAQGMLETFQKSLVQLNELQGQVEQLNETLNGGPNAGAGNVVLSLLIKQVMSSLVSGENKDEAETVGNLQNLDVEQMQNSLGALAEQLNSIETVDVNLIISQIEQVKNSLPQLRDEEIGQSIQLINSYIDGQVIPGEQIQILADKASVDAEKAAPIVKEAVGNQYISMYSSPAGIVNPNPRAELFRVLKEVRATIAGMLALVFTVMFLILDYSTILSTMKGLLARNKRLAGWRRIIDPVKLFGAILGGVLLAAIYAASGAVIPYVGLEHMAVVGLILGIFAAIMCEKFSPINLNEMMAGEALGLSYAQIMRNIVIPNSRPGLLNILNRWKRTF